MFVKSLVLSLLLIGGLALVIFPCIHFTETKYTYHATNLYYDEVHNLVLENYSEALRILYYREATQTYCLTEFFTENSEVEVTHSGVLFNLNDRPVFYCVLITTTSDYVMLGVGVGMLLLGLILIWTMRSSIHVV